jgi:hypothetical protein
MATFYQGQTFSSVEQITNTKLHNLVANASISGIGGGDFSNNFLTSLVSANGQVPPQNLWRLGTPATNASLIDVSSFTSLLVYYSTYGTLATFINARRGQEFRIISGSASFPSILDTGVFLLNGNWIPAKLGDNLSLIWTGANFVELGRIAV